MKRIKGIFITILTFAFGIISVNAASASLSVSRSTIENGNSVTASVSVSNAAAWNIRITSTGSTSGCTQSFADATSDGANTSKTFSVTCKSTSTGIINFTMSGDITSSDGTNSKISGSKQVTVTVPREKSKNNKLKSLSVDGYELSPNFSDDVNEYSVTVPSTVDKINISATKQDGYASLSGTGEKEVEEGINVFEVVVTSETGVSNTYKINVNVEDVDPIEVTVNGKKYTLVKVAKNLEKPELFDETTITIDEKEIPAFKNEVSKYTLVGLKDENGKVSLFIYDNGKYYPFNEYKTDRLSIVFLESNEKVNGFVKRSLKINGVQVTAYKVKGIDKYIVYGINLSNGKENYYTYDSTESTLQKFDMKKYEEQLKNEENNKYIIYGLSGTLLFIFILLLLVSGKNRKLKKYIKLETAIENSTKTANKKSISSDIDDDFLDIEKKKKSKNKNREESDEILEDNILEEKTKNKKSKKK